MARVKMLKTACGPLGSFIVNQIVDIDDDTALAWAECGSATILSTITPPKHIERAVVPTPETAVAPAQRRGRASTRPAPTPPRDPGAIEE